MSATAAETYCEQLSVGGSPSLVVLMSQEEREQLIYELSQLPLIKGPFPPPSFWIGLVGVTMPTLSWQWVNGTPNGKTSSSSPPDVWGDSLLLSPDYPGSYAYVVLDEGYDTGLAHVSRADSTEAYPFVCQYLY
jgi:hypothetical protein